MSVASPFIDKDDAGKAISYRQIIERRLAADKAMHDSTSVTPEPIVQPDNPAAYSIANFTV